MKRPFLPTALAAAAIVLSSCRNSGLPQADSKTYADFCSAFFLGLAGLQSGEDGRAKEFLTRATQLAPGEPAAWVDLGILQMRQQQYDGALGSVQRAQQQAPENSDIEALLGDINGRLGKTADQQAHLEKAVSLNPKNTIALYALAELAEKSQEYAKAAQYLDRILETLPGNEPVLVERSRVAALQGDSAALKRSLASLANHTDWPAPAVDQLQALRTQADSGNVHPLAIRLQFLRNVLLRVPSYRADLDAVKIPVTLVARPMKAFLKLPTPGDQPAAPDLALRFSPAAAPGVKDPRWIGVLALNEHEDPVVAYADANSLHVGPQTIAVAGKMTRYSVAAADLNYDFKSELAIATSDGFQIAGEDAKLPAGIAKGSYTGVWPVDIDLDGDLDLILGTAATEPVILRNNGDGSFTQIHTFAGVKGLRAAAIADINGDELPDIALVDGAGKLHILLNRHLGNYEEMASPVSAEVADIAAGDINGDGWIDFIALQADGKMIRISHDSVQTIAQASGARELVIGDVDNNGALDLIAGNQLFLSDGKNLQMVGAKFAAPAVAFAFRGGLIDPILADGTRLQTQPTQQYKWQIVRTRAAHATGDQRINAFGIGGEIELRSDLLTQTEPITGPVLHFGLGNHADAQFARIVWPNGYVQAEFQLKADQTLLAEQRMKGSCPMLFAWNGHAMDWVKDVGPWGAALGLNVNAQGKGIYAETREWFKIRGDQLAPRNGIYDLRITGEYWETYYIDHYSMLAVDHPQGTEVYTDERFALPPPKPALIFTAEPHPFARAIDDNGNDVSSIVGDLDGRYLDNFGRGEYQGITRDHWVELELPADAPQIGKLYLLADGWMHPTDTTIVKAQEQNSRVHPQPMRIEVPDLTGKWVVAKDNLGFPNGRAKTVVLEISGIFKPGARRALRLRTNLELYWDRMQWAAGTPDTSSVQHLPLSSAQLRYRGFSRINAANLSSPEIPQYGILQQSALHWQMQEGYATKYGDILPLLQAVDDRYVITSPGDEMLLQFPAQPAPKPGWKRDYMLVCDGWVKDGDYNTTYADTIAPLPYHAMTQYITPPGRLEDDPAYKLHPDDWRTYHTRYVDSHNFMTALKGGF